MAILNEWAIMGPNHPMLVLGVILLCIGISMSFAIMSNCERFGQTFFGIAIAMMLIFGGSRCVMHWNDPDHQIPTGKSYIEATFANGAPTAAVLQKYDVIDTDGKVYLLREKDGVEEDRPKVRIGEKKHD